MREHPNLLRIAGLAAHTRWQDLVGPAREFKVKTIALSDPAAARAAQASGDFSADTKILVGPEGLTALACLPEVHTVVSAVVGTAGLAPTLAAIHQGKAIALASKELLVLAGKFITSAAQKSGSALLPVDSEHNAIHQLLRGKSSNEIEKLILTASGGAFRDTPLSELSKVTPAQALQHPNWNMGPKVTIDSATMANKGLELIEARWLFNLPIDRLEVVIHPQSIIHSLIALTDGSLQAQLSPPSMAYPIQDCLLFPQRLPCPAPRLNLKETLSLQLSPPDPARYPCLGLAQAAARQGGIAPALFNAANEVAVAAFVQGQVRFTDIYAIIAETLAQSPSHEPIDLADLLAFEVQSRQLASRLALSRAS